MSLAGPLTEVINKMNAVTEAVSTATTPAEANAVPVALVQNAALEAFKLKCSQTIADAKLRGEDPEAKAAAIMQEKADGMSSSEHVIDPATAAEILLHYNNHNRTLSLAKMHEYSAAMSRGEWQLNHQGLAVYDDGLLGDGQHRLGGVVDSGITQTFLVTLGLSKNVADTIDLSKGRDAGDALMLAKVKDGKLKATCAKKVMNYMNLQSGTGKTALTVIQVEKWVIKHDALMTEALAIAQGSTKNVSYPCMVPGDVFPVAALLMLGGYSKMEAISFIAAVQQGVAPYTDAPTTLLSKIMAKAKDSAKKTDKLSVIEKMALPMKAAAHWTQGESVTKLKWDSKKEDAPDYHKPDTTAGSGFPA